MFMFSFTGNFINVILLTCQLFSLQALLQTLGRRWYLEVVGCIRSILLRSTLGSGYAYKSSSRGDNGRKPRHPWNKCYRAPQCQIPSKDPSGMALLPSLRWNPSLSSLVFPSCGVFLAVGCRLYHTGDLIHSSSNYNPFRDTFHQHPHVQLHKNKHTKEQKQSRQKDRKYWRKNRGLTENTAAVTPGCGPCN